MKRVLSYFDNGGGQFGFRSASEAFKLIEDNTVPVIIPYDQRARHLLQQLKEIEYPGSLMRRLQLYTVSIYEREFQALEGSGLVDIYAASYAVLNDLGHYDPQMGLVLPERSGGEGIFL